MTRPDAETSPHLKAGLAIWAIVALGGVAVLAAYANRPGEPGATPAAWPAGTPLTLADRPALVVFAHPRCPCTRASIAELERALADAPNSATLDILFYRPPNEPENWAHTALWKHAARLPGARLHTDPDGATAAAFAATTSGAVLLYGPNGDLRFHGGITASRAHEGDNPGRTLLTRALRTGRPADASTQVFGCPLGACDPGGEP